MEVYIHGTPQGQKTWGANTHSDYIKDFYNRDSKPTDKSQLQIDLIEGVSLYTYKRFNIVDATGRPEAYFAFTVAFGAEYCSDVFTLYKLFEAVYTKFGGLLIKGANGGGSERYIVSDFTQATHDGRLAVELIQDVIVKNIQEKLGSKLVPLANITTVNKPKKEFNLMEVDSPLFVESMKNYSIIVSPGDATSMKRLEIASKQLVELSARNKETDAANSQLKSKVESLTQQNATLTTQLSQASSASEKKYKSQVEQLTKERETLKKERDELKSKLNNVSSTINQLENPVKEITRLLAGRFPEESRRSDRSYTDNNPSDKQNNQVPLWRKRINSILLCCVLVLNIIILGALLVMHKNDTPEKTPAPPIAIEVPKNDRASDTNKQTSSKTKEETPGASQETAVTETVASVNPEFDYSQCRIDIINGGDKLSLNKYYALQVLSKGNPVPAGTWEVKAKGLLLNEYGSEYFSIDDSSLVGEKVEIRYIVNNKPVITRSSCVIVK